MKFKHTQTETKGFFAALSDNREAGKMTYSKAGNTKIIIDHTEVNPEFKGQGVGRELVFQAVDYARNHRLKIIPLCPFAKKMFENTLGIRDVL